MDNICAQTVDKPWNITGISCAHTSTASMLSHIYSRFVWVKVVACTLFTHHLPTYLSTAYFFKLPLSEHYFYPVSTAPITISTKEIN